MTKIKTKSKRKSISLLNTKTKSKIKKTTLVWHCFWEFKEWSQCGWSFRVAEIQNYSYLHCVTVIIFQFFRYVVLVFDEMKIREDIVFDKSTGEVTGFIGYGDWSAICGAERTMGKTKVGSQQSCHACAHLDGPCCTEIQHWVEAIIYLKEKRGA